MRSLVFLSLVAILSFAHNVGVVMDGDGEFKVTHGHKNELEPYPENKVKSIVAYDNSLKEITINQKQMIGELHFKTESKPLMIASKFDNGIWTKGHFGWENKPKNEVQNPTISKQFLKYSKTLFGYNQSLQKPTGAEIEIIPLSDPFNKDAKNIEFEVLVDAKLVQDYETSNIDIDEKMQKIQSKKSMKLPIQNGKNTILVEFEKSSKELDGISLTAVLEFTRH